MLKEEHTRAILAYDIIVTPPHQFAIGRLAERGNTIFTYEEGRARQIWMAKVVLNYISEASPEFRAMQPVKRQCLYPDENHLNHFPAYSEPNCFLECAWNHARENCGCVPWFLKEYYPHAMICELYGNRCFRSIVDARYGKRSPCHQLCLSDCETVEYDIAFKDVRVVGYDNL